MLGWEDPRGPATEPAPMADVPRLCAGHVGSLWPGRSARGELLCRGAGDANQGGDSPTGGEPGEMAPSIWEILGELDFLGTQHPGQNCQGDGVLGAPGWQSSQGCRTCWW